MAYPIDHAGFGTQGEPVTLPIRLRDSNRRNDQHLMTRAKVFLRLVVDKNSCWGTIMLMLGNNQNFHT